ncbi:MAG: hypothetical protein U0103_23180 [Candidatus Obscuribacterales bacterium]
MARDSSGRWYTEFRGSRHGAQFVYEQPGAAEDNHQILPLHDET